ncbi:MAG TPA: hypothetical protein VH186_36440 [Chloroflexia bacterium]|nr:hypothetical protein [Chloroflexia bacterium]
MIWIIGFRTIIKPLWRGQLTCRRCLRNSFHELLLKTDWGTLFFVPLVPLRRERQLTCHNCGFTSNLSSAEAQNLLSQHPNSLY